MAYYSEQMGLYPTQVRITGARTRFGSCSSQGHICFSWRLMQYPPEAIDYVVVHELAHLRYMSHGAEFYARRHEGRVSGRRVEGNAGAGHPV